MNLDSIHSSDSASLAPKCSDSVNACVCVCVCVWRVRSRCCSSRCGNQKAPIPFPVLEGGLWKTFLLYSCWDLFNSLHLLFLLGSLILLNQPRHRQDKSQEEGCFWVPGNRHFLQCHTKAHGCWKHKGLAIFRDRGGKHTLAARLKHKQIFSKNDLTSFYSPSCHPTRC